MLKLEEILNEILQEPISTPYNCEQVTGKYIPKEKDLRCYFKTNSGNEYVVDFFTIVEPKTVFINGKSIIELSTLVTDDKEYAYLIGLAFSLKERDREDAEEYESSTFENEQYEVLGRVTSVIEQFITNNPKYNILSIMGDTEKRRMDSYLYIFNNQFKDKFNSYKGNSDYFIKK